MKNLYAALLLRVNQLFAPNPVLAKWFKMTSLAQTSLMVNFLAIASESSAK